MVEVSEVGVDPTELTLLEGSRGTLTALVTDQAGTQLSPANVAWAVDDAEVVSVDQQGGVVALAAGTTRVRATVGGFTEGLEPGTYDARVVVESAVATDGPVELTVRLIVEAAEDRDEPDDPDPEDPDDPENPGPSCDIRNRIIFGHLEVPRETSCTISNVRVLGDLRLERGARVNATQLRVDGKLEAKAADELVLVDSRILGDLKFEEGGRATILHTDVGDDFTLEDNRDGPFTLFRNTIAGKLECKANRPAPTGGGNVAGDKKEGQCREL